MQNITFQGGPLDGKTLGLILPNRNATTVSVQVKMIFGGEKSVLHELEYNVYPASSRAVWPIDASEITRDDEGRELTGVEVV